MPREITYKVGMPGAEEEITVEVHEADATPWPLGADLAHVGGEIPRVDGAVKVTGHAKYTWDQHPKGLTFGGLVVSPHAHARVRRIGFPGGAPAGVVATRFFEDKRVTHAGDIVAGICAESPEQLADALAALEVDYEVLPHAVSVADALAEGAPEVTPGQSNDNAGRGPISRGDMAQARAQASVRVAAEFRTQVQTHSALEPHGCVVAPEPDGSATVWASTQAASFFAGRPGGRRESRFSRALGVPLSKIRVLCDHVGGGFGAKFSALGWDVVCAELAKASGRPVVLMLDRRQEHLVGGNRPDSIQRLELLGDTDGRILGLVGETFGTAGNGRGGAGCANFEVYDIGALEMTQHTVSTFTERGCAFRAPRHPQGFFALEGLLDRYAYKIGMDALALRKRNDPHRIRQIQWDMGADKIGWKSRRRAKPGSDEGPVKRGVGCAAARWNSAGRPPWQIEITVEGDGSVIVRSGTQDIGTGTRTVLAILVAEELGLAPGDIEVQLADTRFPPGPPSGGSVTAPSIGPAAREAALRAKEGLADALAAHWEGVSASQIRFEKGAFVTDGGKRASFAEAAAVLPASGLTVRGTRRQNWQSPFGETAGCQFAEVAVDTETGVVTVERVVAVHDCGRVVDELTSRSQVNGGVIQGISYALYEERHLDRAQGDMVNPTLDTYRICGIADCPPIDVIMTSVVSGHNNVGMMGLGEPATVPTAAAVANAVYNAIGVQVRELPMTPARVLAALAEGA